MEDKITRMKELINILNKASELYYQKNTIMMTDYEYDHLYDELVELEKETNMTLSNSPTINVEPEISSSLKQVEHPSPMLSLAKTKKVSELENFLGDKEGLLSWKLDGLTIVLTYEDGKLISGVTRGTGIIGELVTENVKQFKNVPLTIPYKGRLVLRGEAIIKYSDFNRMNEELGDGSSQYKNPRNLCSGSVRQLDSSITAKRCVNCIIFALIESSTNISNLKSECFDWLKNQGFEVVEHYKVTKNTVKEQVLMFKEKVKEYDIPSDGLVITYDDIAYGNSLGTTAKFPKHSLAFKWKDETVATTLRKVDWLVSRTGLINPVAVFDPVELEGTIVSRASVHNVSILEGLKLGIGDTIMVYKANMIIPQIASNSTQSGNLEIPDRCPVCGSKASIISNSDVKYLYCMNDFCKAKLIKRLSLFVSRNAMNIDGISDMILNKLITEKIVNNYKDLYHLDRYKDKIIAFDGFGEKSYSNMINSIEKSRHVKLANFIYALGIPDIGFSRAKLICNHFNNDFNKISNLTYEELSNISGVGDVIAKEWIDTFSNPDFIEELKELKEEIDIPKASTNSNKDLDGLTFVITGSLNKFTNRDTMIEFIEEHGGKVVTSISSKVNYLINNDITSTSTKNNKAKELGINIIDEDKFLELIKEK
ncbi:MAG: NAD-dependent DNA ligase LigA [Bacilli bacterium]|nr:NAD-dependent DNA ligase LigA [Bacilli bacterium]MDY5995930.1 NAD-dependent DNA ligase LigA [Bacilli bacterium]